MTVYQWKHKLDVDTKLFPCVQYLPNLICNCYVLYQNYFLNSPKCFLTEHLWFVVIFQVNNCSHYMTVRKYGLIRQTSSVHTIMMNSSNSSVEIHFRLIGQTCSLSYHWNCRIYIVVRQYPIII